MSGGIHTLYLAGPRGPVGEAGSAACARIAGDIRVPNAGSTLLLAGVAPLEGVESPLIPGDGLLHLHDLSPDHLLTLGIGQVGEWALQSHV